MLHRWFALTPFLLAAFAAVALPGDALLAFDDPVAADATAEAAAETAETAVELTPEMSLDYTINTLVMLFAAVLVIAMQAGFALLEVGLNSQKNTVNILFKNLMDFCMGVLLFITVGYGLMYPGGTDEEKAAAPWFKFGSSMVTRDAQAGESEGSWAEPPSSASWSNSADFMFQVAFAATAATIVSGAVAGRMKFGAYLVYSVVITSVVYPISGYWKWGGGQLAQWGFHDFAGSIVVHAVGGFAALAGALVLGPRIGRFRNGKAIPMPGHNLTFAALGVFILLVGWYGFNPGSQLTYNGFTNAELTSYIALTTTLAAAAGGVSAMLASWAKSGKPDLTMALNGVLAGLVGITANCDRVEQWEAILIGASAGLLVYGGVLLLDKLQIDDPVGAFPVHGMCGVWGGLATGIFGNPTNDLSQMDFFLVQLKSTAIVCAWAFVTMLIVFAALRAIGMLRVDPEEEVRGLDLGEHGMEAYVVS